MKKTLIAALVIFVLGIGIVYISNRKSTTPVTNYEECVEQNNIILESYPPQCRTGDGKSFTQDIGNELEKTDLITIENPRPNQRIKSPLNITGRARGQWFFEADAPAKLVDKNGNIIAEGHIQAQGEWMTSNFVIYEGKIIFETNERSGKLIIEKANPSGLPENADSLEIPVKF